MGDFRMTVEAVGGHGCDRKAKAGGPVQGCGSETCPDCIFARFVSEMKRAGMHPTKAMMHHWPADMAKHDIEQPTPDPASKRCRRCNADRAMLDLPCRNYDATHEVVDDYTERDVKYPTSTFRRAAGVRLKGSF
jgi:hypothetical protein